MGNTERVWILLAKKKAREASEAELLELEELMELQALRGQASEVTDKVWEAPLVANPDLRPGPRVWEKIEREMGQTVSHRMPVWRMLAAASILVLLGLTAVIVGQHRKGEVAVRKPNQYSTPPGSKSKLDLPDGTQVWLNGNSKLMLDTTGREVYLSGEAFFDVAKNDQHPFIIHTGVIDITVLGTAFNVKAYPGEKNIETALVRGLIEITTHNDPDRKIILKPNEKITIPTDTALAGAPRSTSTADPSTLDPSVYSITALSKGPSGVVPETVWMQRKLEFDNEPFAELAPKMEAWFDIRIRFGNEKIRNKRFSGVIEKETLEETLRYMRLSTPFTYSLKGNELLIN